MLTGPLPLGKLTRLIQGRRNQTILDQVMVSGSNFATTILLVRALGLKSFGTFAVLYSLILLVNGVQLSFICSPMMTLAALAEEGLPRSRYLRGIFGVELCFCLLSSVTATVAAGIYLMLRGSAGEAHLLPAFLVGMVAFLLQDWLRRYYFAAGRAQHSLWNDMISYLGQALVLLGLAYFHRLTINSALWAIAVTSSLAFLLGQAVERLGSSREEMLQAWRQSRHLSRDLAIANQLQWFVYQGALLFGAGILGAEAAGSIRATQNVVGPINVAYQALDNLVPLRAGEEMRRSGIAGLARFLFRFGSQGFVVLLLLFSGIALFSRQFLSFFYGHTVSAYAGILNLQMLYFLLLWPLRQLTYLFRTIDRTPSILLASLAAALTSLVFLYPSVRAFHALGIMVAAVAGQSANLLYLAVAWMRIRTDLVAKAGELEKVERVEKSPNPSRIAAL